MDCLTFSKWLENRDMHDVSEADKALKHTAICRECQRKLSLDEQIDNLIYRAMEPVVMPEFLQNSIDLNLDRVGNRPSQKRKLWYGLLPAALAAMVVFFVVFPFSSGIRSMDEFGKHVIADHTGHDDSVLVVAELKALDSLDPDFVQYAKIKSELPQDSRFVGARICPLGDCSAVHLVYSKEGKRQSLYIVREEDVDFSLSLGRQYTMTAGEHLVRFWKKDGRIYALTS